MSSVQRHRFVLRKVIRFAQRNDLVNRNVAELANLPNDAKARREPRALTTGESRALLEAARTHTVKIPKTDKTETHPRRLEALWTVSLLLGLRPGEVTGLLWDAVDLDDEVLHVRTSMKYHDGTPVGIGEVKTGNMGRGRRTLAMPPQVADALRRHRTAQAKERLAFGDAWPSEWRRARFRVRSRNTAQCEQPSPRAERHHRRGRYRPRHPLRPPAQRRGRSWPPQGCA